MNGTMTAIATMCLILSAAAAARAADDKKPANDKAATTKNVVMDITWQKHGDTAEFTPSTQPGKKGDVLKVTGPGTHRVLVLDNPKISHHTYAVLGRVKYENVQGTGYLEMWNTFPDGGAFFSRTLAGGGPMGSLGGSSDWRPFVLPFYAKEGMRPSKLEINIVVPQGGTVYLEPAQLVQELEPSTGLPKGITLPPSAGGSTSGAAWWNPRMSGWVGGVGGAVLGTLGAIVGLLAGRGRARRVVIGLLMTILITGGTSLLMGLVALSLRQPYHVYYPLLLCGVIATLVPLTMLPQLKRRYEELELRRMTALDAAS